MDDFKTFVAAARTCRRFVENRPLAQSDLDWLVECARVAPSARNAQQLRFILTSRGETATALFPLLHWAGALKDWDGPAQGERPTGYIAILMPEAGGETVCYDVGIACQTMQLAAHSRGWGCCIIKSFNASKTTQLLAAPKEMKIVLVLAFGVAGERRLIADMPANGSFSYWRDAQGVHYVPKRPLSELVVRRFQ